MSSPVQALIKSSRNTSNASRSRPGTETDGEAFQAELGKAAERAKKPEHVEDPKPGKTSRSRKCETKETPPQPDADETSVENTDAPEAPTQVPVGEAVPADVVALTVVPRSAEPMAAEESEEPVSPLVALVSMASTAPTEAPPIVEGIAEATATPATKIAPTLPTPVDGESTEKASVAVVTRQGVPVPTETTQVDVPSDQETLVLPEPKHDLKKSVEAPVIAEEALAKPVVQEEKRFEVPASVKTEAPTVEAPQVAPKSTADVMTTARPQATERPPEARFADNNHDNIVRSVRMELLPRGGTMQIRLDPPELGALNVILSIRDGVATASFQTSNEQATQLLSHSLGQLKTAMESTGITVDKLQVQQAHKSQDSQSSKEDNQQRGQPGGDEMARQQEQQRKEMLRKLWRRLNVGSDPLDLVA